MVGVVLATIRLFFHLTEDLPDIHADVFERIKCKHSLDPFAYLFLTGFVVHKRQYVTSIHSLNQNDIVLIVNHIFYNDLQLLC